MHFLQAINSDISVLIVCNKTGGTIKGDIKKEMCTAGSDRSQSFSDNTMCQGLFTSWSKAFSSRAAVFFFFHVKSTHVRRQVLYSLHFEGASDSFLHSGPFAMPYMDILSLVLLVT